MKKASTRVLIDRNLLKTYKKSLIFSTLIITLCAAFLFITLSSLLSTTAIADDLPLEPIIEQQDASPDEPLPENNTDIAYTPDSVDTDEYDDVKYEFIDENNHYNDDIHFNDYSAPIQAFSSVPIDITDATLVVVNGTFTYSGLPQVLTAIEVTLPDTAPIILTYSSDFDFTYTGSTGTNAGSASITITGTGDYTGSVSGGFSIAKASLTVTAEDKAITFRDVAPAFTADVTGFVNNENMGVLGGTLAFDTNYITGANAGGSYSITPKDLTSDNYEITFVSGTLTVNRLDIGSASVVVSAPPVYSGSALTPTPVVTLGTALSPGTDFSITGHSGNINAGTNTASVIVAGEGNYTGTATGTFSIAKAPLTVTADDLAKRFDNTMPLAFTVRYAGFVGGQNNSVLGGTLAFSSDYNEGDPVGVYVITPRGYTSDNYDITFVNGTLTIEPALTVGISITPTGVQNFGSVVYGYSTQTDRMMTVSNTGNTATAALTVVLSGNDASSFTLSKSSLPSITAGGSDTFTVRPVDGLDVGTYSAIVTVSDGTLSADFNVSFTVTPLSITAGQGTYTITKVFDGNNTVISPTGSLALSGVLASDTSDVNLNTGTVGTYNNINVGTSHTVILSGLNITGDKANNYTLSNTSLSITNAAITQATVTGIAASAYQTSITLSAFDARNAGTAEMVAFIAGLPDNVPVTLNSGGLNNTLLITWGTSVAFDPRGTVYTFTGTLTGNANMALPGTPPTASSTVMVTPVTAVNPTFSSTSVTVGTNSAATASDLGPTVLPTSGTITVQGTSVSYNIIWGSQTLNTTVVGSNQLFTGTIGYVSPPDWLTLPSLLSVSRTVFVADKTQVTISGITISSKVFDGLPIAPTGTVNAGAANVNSLVWLYESTDSGTYSGSTPPVNAGNYKLTIRLPESDPLYLASPLELTFSIIMRPITLVADSFTVIITDNLPTLTFSVTNLAPGHTVTNALATMPTLDSPSFNRMVPGAYTIALTDGTASDNYTITTRTNGQVTVEGSLFEPPPAPITSAGTEVELKVNSHFVHLHSSSLNGNPLTHTVVDNGAKVILSGYPGYTGNIGEAVSGSTIITFYKEFLDFLPNGTHTLSVQFMEDGAAEPYASPTSSFVLNRTVVQDIIRNNPDQTTGGAPQTSDNTNIVVWWFVLFTSAVGLTFTVVLRKHFNLKTKWERLIELYKTGNFR